jgi:hypothetical protein
LNNARRTFEWQNNREVAPVLLFTGHLNFAAHQIDEVLDNAQP